MKIFSSVFLAGFLIIIVGSYFSLTEIKPAVGGDFKVGLVGTPRFINPILSQTNNSDQDLSVFVFSSLLKNDGQGNLINDLAQEVKIGDNGKVYEVFLKKAKWQDGKNVTADDVIFTLSLILDSEYKSPLRLTWQGVEIEKIDDLAVRFKLKTAYAPFSQNLTFGILPKHLWENVSASSFALHEMNLKAIGSGPYKFSKLQKDKNGVLKFIEFKAFDNYFGGKPYARQITFYFYPTEEAAASAFKKSEIDLLGQTAASEIEGIKKDNSETTFLSLSLPRYFAVFFNSSQNKLLAEKPLRQALALATDKKELINEVLGSQGKAIDSPILEGMTGFTDSIKKYDFDPVKAREILEANNWVDQDNDGFREKTGQVLELTLTTVDLTDLSKTAQILQKQWSRVGVKVNLDIKEMSKIQAETVRPRQYQALIFGEILTLEPDPFSFWHSSMKKDPGLNLALYENREADKILEEARVELDKNIRAEKYKKFCELVTEDLPAIFLFSPSWTMSSNNKIKGVDSSSLNTPADRFSLINYWFLETQRAWK